jgi:hypothetical protein
VGTRKDRAIADARFLLGLLLTDMDVDLAHRYHVSVRLFGKLHWPGGRYTDDPEPVPPPLAEAP